MRYELSDYEWTAIKPMLPNKPRGVRRVSDRRVLNGIFWVLRSGAPWRDLPETYGPGTTLQSLRSLAAGWRLGPDHGCAGCWRLPTRSGRSNTPRCAVLLLVPASASALCFSRKLRHAGCPSSCRGRGLTRRHALGALDLI